MVTYDIANERRRAKASRVLEDYGRRVLESVFECDLDQKQYARLRARLERWIKAQEDGVRVYLLCEACVARIEALGVVRPVERRPPYYIV